MNERIDDLVYRQAAENLAGVPVSIEPDGTVWAGIYPGTPVDTALVQAEYERLETAAAATEADRQATIQAARDHAASLGFTDAMLAVMYPNLTP